MSFLRIDPQILISQSCCRQCVCQGSGEPVALTHHFCLARRLRCSRLPEYSRAPCLPSHRPRASRRQPTDPTLDQRKFHQRHRLARPHRTLVGGSPRRCTLSSAAPLPRRQPKSQLLQRLLAAAVLGTRAHPGLHGAAPCSRRRHLAAERVEPDSNDLRDDAER